MILIDLVVDLTVHRLAEIRKVALLFAIAELLS